MSSIQTSVGLISGIPIQDTVDQLMQVASVPLNRLSSRTQGLQSERAAVDTMAALVMGLKSSLDRFQLDSTYTAKTATSSHENLLAASILSGESPAAGEYQFTPVQTASAHQLISGSFADLTNGLGDGTLSFRFGGHVDSGLSLTEINDGAGFVPGKIKITDRSGDTAEVDLRGARKVSDVVNAINANSEINISASVSGDQFVLTDTVGGAGNLVVEEVGLGTTAASLGLGLGSITVDGDTATGADIFDLHANTSLSLLNDANGVRIVDDLETVDDLTISLADETSAGVDLSGASTLQDVVDAINDDEDFTGKLTASIADDGRRLEITDHTTGAGAFSVSSVGTGSAAEDLGLTETADGGAITGARLVAGLQDTLVSSLQGGQGFELNDIDITDRAGNPVVNVDLSSAETLGEVVNLINDSGAQVTAQINNARNGIVISDTSGGAGDLLIANGATGATADDLGIAVEDAVASVNSGTLNRQTISESTLLSSINGGSGITLGDIRITDSSGEQGVLDLNSAGLEAETIGDVIDAVNALSIDVEARINDAGDGILLTDTAGGASDLIVTDINGSTAADLGLAGVSSETDADGHAVIDGSTSYSVDLSDLETDANAIALSTLNNGSGVQQGVFKVETSDGEVFAVNLAEADTIGDVLDAINAAASDADVQVTAELTSGGTGIELIDKSSGEGTLTVTDLGRDTAAEDLGIAGTADDDGKITSTGLFDADDAEKSSLDLVIERINSLEAGVTASSVFDGVGYRLALHADETGAANELLVDDNAGLFSFSEVSRPQDAVLLFGASATSSGFAVASSTNEFDQTIDGLNLTVHQASDEPVTVTVEADTQPIVKSVKDFVASYNSVRTTLDTFTSFDEETNSTGVLFGRNEALRVDTTLSRLASGSFAIEGQFTSLEAIGISLDDKGQLSLNQSELLDALEESAGDVERLLGDEDFGLYAEFDAAIEQLAAGENSLLSARSDALESTIESNTARLEDMSETLDRQRDRMLLEFYQLEEALAGFESNLSLLDSIQSITIESS